VKLSGPLRWFLGRFPVLWQVRITLAAGLVMINLVGSILLLLFASQLVPMPDVADKEGLRLHNLLLALASVVVGSAITIVASRTLMTRLAVWLREDRAPDDVERRAVLRAPAYLFLLDAALWGAGAAMFGVFNAVRAEVAFGVLMGVMVGLSGLSASALAYLVAERALRPMARRALANGVPERVVVPSVAARSMVAWALSSGVAMLGVSLAGIVAIVLRDTVTIIQLAVSMVAMGGVGFAIGAFTNWLAARASSDPVRALRQAVAQVGEGNLNAHVDIYDGTEIGILQAGFNDMLEGLRERDNIRDLFGRHVGTDVARTALEGGVQLGGEVRDITVLFVDIIGSTTMATERPPQEVVALLNRFFDVVIDTVHGYDGWINKFEGDAALAIWGAPVQVANKETAALRAARVMGERLRREVPELAAGIGVSGGPAVAGNVGAAERYEYTVIGDPVNEASRLMELAKTVQGHVVANARLLEAAGAETDHWVLLEPVVVRGRSDPTLIASPRTQ
jgi:adenylate cyclase